MPNNRPLSNREIAWIKRLQKCFNARPNRLGFYTIGDPNLIIYDRRFDDQIHALMDSHGRMDFCTAVDDLDAYLDSVRTGADVHSTAG